MGRSYRSSPRCRRASASASAQYLIRASISPAAMSTTSDTRCYAISWGALLGRSALSGSKGGSSGGPPDIGYRALIQAPSRVAMQTAEYDAALISCATTSCRAVSQSSGLAISFLWTSTTSTIVVVISTNQFMRRSFLFSPWAARTFNALPNRRSISTATICWWPLPELINAEYRTTVAEKSSIVDGVGLFLLEGNMWRKTCLAVALCAGFTLLTNSSAKALLVDGSYTIELTGALIDPSPGTFDVIGGIVQNFTMDLLVGGSPANPPNSTYSSGSTLVTVAGGSMFEGLIFNDNFFGDDNDSILFATDNTWICAVSNASLCEHSDDGALIAGDGGEYSISQTSVSEIPLPAALWLFLTALGGLGLFGWRRKQSAAA